MDIAIIIIFLIIIGCLIMIWYITTYNGFQNYIIRINEAEANIDTTLRKRFDLLDKSIGLIKNNTNEEIVLDELSKLRDQKLTNFELDRKIYSAISEFNAIKEQYKDLKKCEGFLKIELSINETEAEIVASRKYYNDIITDYNKLTKTFPSNIVGKICKFSTRTYFDGKNMEDDDFEDMKI